MLISEYSHKNKKATIHKQLDGYSVMMYENLRLVETVNGLGSLESAEYLADGYIGVDGTDPVFLNE
jgi:hypothetical protein